MSGPRPPGSAPALQPRRHRVDDLRAVRGTTDQRAIAEIGDETADFAIGVGRKRQFAQHVAMLTGFTHLASHRAAMKPSPRH